jgi:hypothetical protein
MKVDRTVFRMINNKKRRYMNVYEMIQNKPHLHVFGDGTPRLMSLLDHALKWMADELSAKPNAVTLETGYGLTTVLMTMLARKHYSIAPDEPGYQRVLNYCEQNGIPSNSLEYFAGRSEDVLPSLAIEDESLDLVLIDGGHGFPTPFVDYAYTFKKIKIGGYLVVDDLQLVTGMMLRDFLLQSEEWKLAGYFDGKTCSFRKEMHTDGKDWSRQPYMTQMNERTRSLLSGRGPGAIEKLCLVPMIAAPEGTQLLRATRTDTLLSRIVIEKLETLWSKEQIAHVAIFGAGKHTEWMEEILRNKQSIPRIVAILDDAPDGKPNRFGLKPINAREFNVQQVEAIVLSSDCLQKSMKERCRSLYGHIVKIVDLYEGLPAGPYSKD